MDALDFLVRYQLHSRLPADRRQPALQNTHAGFPRVRGNDLPDRPIRHPQLPLLQAVALELLGHQVVFGNLKLLLVGVAGQLDQLHPVQQGPGNRLGGIGSSDKEHLGQVEGQFHKVVPEGRILLRVQHLQQSRRRVSPVVGAHLVNLIQQKQRIAAPRLVDGVQNTAGHRTHVGLAVAPDLRLVVDAAQRNTGQLPVHGLGHRHRNGGLTHARRAYQTQNLAFQLRRELLHRHKFQNALLHLFQPKMVLVQGLAYRGHIGTLLGALAPGQFQADIQIIPDDRSLRGAVGLLGQTAQLLFQLLPDLLGQLGLRQLLAVLRQVRVASFALP